jgi:hypothetical protein
MKKDHYILFDDSGNKILTNPKIVPINAIKIDMKDFPKGISPSFVKYDKETKKILPLSLLERNELIFKAKKAELRETPKLPLKPVLAGFMVGLILGAIGVWQLFN